jgi:hypothetical protein
MPTRTESTPPPGGVSERHASVLEDVPDVVATLVDGVVIGKTGRVTTSLHDSVQTLGVHRRVGVVQCDQSLAVHAASVRQADVGPLINGGCAMFVRFWEDRST